MYIGILEIKIRVYDSYSLKDKRKVLRSIFDKVDHRFNVSFAEVDYQDIHNLSLLGFSCVSGSHGYAKETIDSLVEYLHEDFNYEILEYYIDVL